MNKLKLLKEKDFVKVYKGNNCKIYYGDKTEIFGDNDKNPYELIYLIFGELEVQIKDNVELIKAPAKFEIQANTYHKLSARTNVIFEIYVK